MLEAFAEVKEIIEGGKEGHDFFETLAEIDRELKN